MISANLSAVHLFCESHVKGKTEVGVGREILPDQSKSGMVRRDLLPQGVYQEGAF